MKLGEIRDYIKQHDTPSLADVATHFDISQAAAKLALDYWVKKGVVQQQGASCRSGSCGGCSTKVAENYRWRG